MKSIKPQDKNSTPQSSADHYEVEKLLLALSHKEQEIEKLKELVQITNAERTRERKYSIGFISQVFKTFWGYDDEFNSQMRSIFNKINTEIPINEQIDTVFELQSSLQEQAKKNEVISWYH